MPSPPWPHFPIVIYYYILPTDAVGNYLQFFNLPTDSICSLIEAAASGGFAICWVPQPSPIVYWRTALAWDPRSADPLKIKGENLSRARIFLSNLMEAKQGDFRVPVSLLFYMLCFLVI